VAQNVRSIKSRIGNITDIAQITKAMNAIAMTKLTRIKRQLDSIRPYMTDLDAFTQRLLGRLSADAEAHPLTAPNKVEEIGVFVLNSDRGLCGRYKGDLNRKTEELLSEHGRNSRLILGGEKARLYFARRHVNTLATYSHTYDQPTAEIAGRIANELMTHYETDEVGRVDLVYMTFLSDLSQRVVVQQFLPLELQPTSNDDLIDPEAEVMLDIAVRMTLRAKLYAALLETKTSEIAIRRQAMKAATDNAEDLITSLTRAYNKARQQAITREIADIIGGAEALRMNE